ncbi:unnamed protein product [Paramecium octaurelia]|uniref:Uncharacterized protein n=1 Tax=Paramecium octaurelia TaxID=43137 RepID=A0A8S1YQ85_PAROT|nr:unnamed protein product [Paramecium octaurelia]
MSNTHILCGQAFGFDEEHYPDKKFMINVVFILNFSHQLFKVRYNTVYQRSQYHTIFNTSLIVNKLMVILKDREHSLLCIRNHSLKLSFEQENRFQKNQIQKINSRV